MPDWKVGDEVIVTGRYARQGRTTIAKIGRKYFYVEGMNRDTPFQISDGHEKPDGFNNYQARAWTPDQYSAHRTRTGVLDKLRAHGVSWAPSWGSLTFREQNFTTARLMELLHLLDYVAEDNATTNLDEEP